jgi:hypothetical protein
MKKSEVAALAYVAHIKKDTEKLKEVVTKTARKESLTINALIDAFKEEYGGDIDEFDVEPNWDTVVRLTYFS